MPVKDECSDRRLVKVVTRQKQAPLYTGRAQGARRDTDSNSRRVERVTSVAVSQFAASDPSVTMLVNNPVYDAHEMCEEMADPAETITLPMGPMAGTLTAAVGAATGIQDSSRSSEAASRSLLPPASTRNEMSPTAS